MSNYRRSPQDCMPGDMTDKEAVADWPEMSNLSAVAFKRFTGIKLDYGRLVRKGNHIFEVGASELALCRYNHTRQF